MGKMLKLTIPGKPIPLQRARTSKGIFFDPLYLVKKNIRTYIKEQLPDDFKPFTEPLELDVVFYMPVPKAVTKGMKERLKQGEKIPHNKLFDLDNGLKFIADCFNKMLFLDDRQIWKISAKKVWALEGKTCFTLIPTVV